MIALLITFLFLLLFCSGFFSASETALFSLSSMKVKTFKQDKDPHKQLVARLLAHPSNLLVTLIILNVIANILIQNVVSSIFGEYSGWLLNVGVPLGLTLIFGEVIPKSIGLASNTKVAPRVAPVLQKAEIVLFPLRKALTGITHYISRVMFFFLTKEAEISTDELRYTLKTSRQYGILQDEEIELMEGLLHLKEATVKDLMRPREEVLFFDIQEEPLGKLLHLFIDQECSRLPICREGLDNILGMISVRLFFLHQPHIHTEQDLLPILKKPFFVPESTSADTLLRQMYERKESLAIVVDEYGAVSGLIALEDLVEAVVGEIVDRRDEKSRYTRSGEDVLIASGKLELAEFEGIFGVFLKSENHMVTIGGWLTEQLGDIPKLGTKFVTADFLFHVLAADPKRIRRLYIRRLNPLKRKK